MTSKIIASRYARALLKNGLPDKVEQIRQNLDAIMEIYQDNPTLPKILRHPMISQADKKIMIDQALGGKIDPSLVRFAEILIAKKRIGLLPDISEIYNLLADEALGIIKAKITTSFPITEPQQAAIMNKLSRLTKKTVIMDIQINPALIGGITVKIGDLVMDGSIRTRLKDLKEKMLAKA